MIISCHRCRCLFASIVNIKLVAYLLSFVLRDSYREVLILVIFMSYSQSRHLLITHLVQQVALCYTLCCLEVVVYPVKIEVTIHPTLLDEIRKNLLSLNGL